MVYFKKRKREENFMYDFNSAMGASAEDTFALSFLIVYLIMMLFYSAFGILSYVLNSLGTYTIASRRGIKNAWLAWIPLGSSWILGSISDHYQAAKGKIKRKRVVLLTLEIILYVVLFMVMGSLFGMVFQMISYGDATITDQQAMEMMGSMGSVFVGYFAMFGIAIALMVVYYFCLYDLYNSCRPENSVLYLVLSILISFITPFLIFSCRKKDLGMPAPQPQYQPQYQPPVYGQQPPWQSVQHQHYQPEAYQPQQYEPYQPQQPVQPQLPAEPWEQQDQQ